MTDKIDELFAEGLEKLSSKRVPLELQVNKEKGRQEKRAFDESEQDLEKNAYFITSDGKNINFHDRKTNKKAVVVPMNHPEYVEFKEIFDRVGHNTKLQLDPPMRKRAGLEKESAKKKDDIPLWKEMLQAAWQGAKGGAIGGPGYVVGKAKADSIKKEGHAKAIRDAEKTAAEDERAFTATRYYKKRFLRPGMKEVRRTIAIRGKIPAGALVPKPEAEMKKKSSLDEQFNADMRQIVGVEAMDKEANWERPDVYVEGQTTDRIDDHFIGWMKEKADEDVVKEADFKQDLAREVAQNPDVPRIAKAIGKGMRRGVLLGAGGTLAAGALTAGGMKIYNAGKKKGAKSTEGLDKEAGVQQNPENLDLLARIRKNVEEKSGLSLDV